MSLATASQSEIQLLSKSPAFAMSLGAKELFHTNFLAFLLESDDPTLVPIQLAIRDSLKFPLSLGAVPRCEVWREKNNLDLVVVELQPAPTASETQEVSPEEEIDQTEAESGGWIWNPTGGWKDSDRTVPTCASAGASAAKVITASSFSQLIPTNRVLLVEAKLKSIPRVEQLIEYDEQLAGTGIRLKFPEDGAVSEWTLRVQEGGTIQIERRLLSVAGGSVTTPATATRSPGQWDGVTWKSLQRAMSAALSNLAKSSLAQTMTDYTDALGALVALIDRVHQMCDDAHRTPGAIPTYGSMRQQTLDAQFKSLRINDLLGKTLFDHWLHKHVCHAATSIIIPMGWTMNSYVNYSNGTPGLGVELVNDHFQPPNAKPIELRIGVQIQNREFRLFIDVKAGWSGLEGWIAAHPLLLQNWFSTPVFKGAPVGYRGKAVRLSTGSSRATTLKVFNVDRFLYSACDIDHRSVVDVVDELERVLTHAAGLAPSL